MKIKKLEDDWVMPTKEAYEKVKNKYVANYTVYEPGHSTGFLGWKRGRDVNKPDIGLAKWNEYYPEGYNSWAGQQGTTYNAYGEHLLTAKINEIIDRLNKKK